MLAMLEKERPTGYIELSPTRTARRRVEFYMMENLLEARASSSFPTNFYVPDEDVNVYLAHLLTAHLEAPVASSTVAGCTPQFNPPPKSELSRRQRADYYRLNGDHRLVCLGLYDRGDLLRRRKIAYSFTETESRQRDMVCGQSCYRAATSLLTGRHTAYAGLAATLAKLDTHFADYVYVLQVMARRGFGLGAQLSDGSLERLLTGSDDATSTLDEDANVNGSTISMDTLLDLLLAYRRDPTPERRAQLVTAARAQGIQPQKLLSGN